jgi:small conductance mechanosensitive channel
VFFSAASVRLGSKLFNRFFAKTSNNKALEQLFSTVFMLQSLSTLLCLSARLNKALSSSSILQELVVCLVLLFFQDIAANFLSGIILAFREPLKEET